MFNFVVPTPDYRIAQKMSVHGDIQTSDELHRLLDKIADRGGERLRALQLDIVRRIGHPEYRAALNRARHLLRHIPFGSRELVGVLQPLRQLLIGLWLGGGGYQQHGTGEFAII